jgi:hypothetical protein
VEEQGKANVDNMYIVQGVGDGKMEMCRQLLGPEDVMYCSAPVLVY